MSAPTDKPYLGKRNSANQTPSYQLRLAIWAEFAKRTDEQRAKETSEDYYDRKMADIIAAVKNNRI